MSYVTLPMPPSLFNVFPLASTMCSARMSSDRLRVHPRLRLGLLHLGRKRPWPECPNPETGNQWSDDMRDRVVRTLTKMEEEGRFVLVAQEGGGVVKDEVALREAVGKHI